MYSNKLSQYYNSLMGDYSSIINTTNDLVKSYVPKSSSILELGCGTGNILKNLPKSYELHGLDNSEGMLSIAQNQVPNATFYLDDMTTFKLGRKFDAILCIFDSINHLTSKSQWKKTFSNVYNHLRDDGVFVFDMNTVIRLEKLSTYGAAVFKVDKNVIITMKVNKEKSNLYYVKFQMFEDINKKDVVYTEEVVYESAFESEVVEELLSKNFKLLKKLDPSRKRITKESGRIFYVCKLK